MSPYSKNKPRFVLEHVPYTDNPLTISLATNLLSWPIRATQIVTREGFLTLPLSGHPPNVPRNREREHLPIRSASGYEHALAVTRNLSSDVFRGRIRYHILSEPQAVTGFFFGCCPPSSCACTSLLFFLVSACVSACNYSSICTVRAHDPRVDPASSCTAKPHPPHASDGSPRETHVSSCKSAADEHSPRRLRWPASPCPISSGPWPTPRHTPQLGTSLQGRQPAPGGPVPPVLASPACLRRTLAPHAPDLSAVNDACCPA